MSYVTGDLRDQLANLGRSVVRAGLVVGSGGNMSARIPDTDECWVSASGTWLDRLDHAAFVRVRGTDRIRSGVAGDGHSVAGHRAGDGGAGLTAAGAGSTGAGRGSAGAAGQVPTSELAVHLAAYQVRQDAQVVVHLHPQTVLLVEALDEPIVLATTDHRYYLGRVAVLPYRPPGSVALAEAVGAAAGAGYDCMVLARHGCVVLAETVELAHKRVLYLEEAARFTYRAMLAGRKIPDFAD